MTFFSIYVIWDYIRLNIHNSCRDTCSVVEPVKIQFLDIQCVFSNFPRLLQVRHTYIFLEKAQYSSFIFIFVVKIYVNDNVRIQHHLLKWNSNVHFLQVHVQVLHKINFTLRRLICFIFCTIIPLAMLL
jgi:hypothetical protein